MYVKFAEFWHSLPRWFCHLHTMRPEKFQEISGRTYIYTISLSLYLDYFTTLKTRLPTLTIMMPDAFTVYCPTPPSCSLANNTRP